MLAFFWDNLYFFMIVCLFYKKQIIALIADYDSLYVSFLFRYKEIFSGNYKIFS